MDDDSARLLARLCDGEELAADEVFHRYVGRLVGLARRRLSPKLARKHDPEDIVQSAYRSFFRLAGVGRFDVQRGGDLWRLLAAITVRKVLKKAERYQAAKRSLNQEESISSQLGVAPERIAREPTTQEAAQLEEELNRLMKSLKPLHQTMLQLRLQGHTVAEIAEQTDRAERQVRRVLNKARDDLEGRFFGETQGHG